MRFPLHRKIGVGIVVLGMAPLFFTMIRGHAHNWQPLKVAVTLVPGEFQSPEFKTDLNGRYLVALVLDQLPDLLKEQCLMGIPVPGGACKGVTSAIEFDWQIVSDNGSRIMSGAYDPAGFSGTESDFAEFQGKPGKRQRLVMNIKRDAGELNAAHPRLVVQAGPEYWEGLPDMYQISYLWAGTVGVLGVMWVLVPIIFRAGSGHKT